MAMLAEPRRKQKWTLNPRGKQWSDDSSKFGQKMLEKMGWTSGKGLGANEQGMKEHVRVKLKDDRAGFGFSFDAQNKLWNEHHEGYEELLQKLQSTTDTDKIEINTDANLSGNSLELKSKQSRARVHYRKFTRGKDINRYSSKDLANIFGKKELPELLPFETNDNQPTKASEKVKNEPMEDEKSCHQVKVEVKHEPIEDEEPSHQISVDRPTKKRKKVKNEPVEDEVSSHQVKVEVKSSPIDDDESSHQTNVDRPKKKSKKLKKPPINNNETSPADDQDTENDAPTIIAEIVTIRKKKKKKRKIRAEPELVDLEDELSKCSASDKVEGVMESVKRKKKKKSSERERKIDEVSADVKVLEKNENHGESEVEKNVKKSKKKLKSLLKSSNIILDFPGANINDIRGYGSDL